MPFTKATTKLSKKLHSYPVNIHNPLGKAKMNFTQSAETISVIIPAHNAERHILRALDSVSSQTRTPNEIIVVDNLSTDGTVESAQAWTGKIPVKVLKCHRPGSAAARNEGIKAAEGSILAFLDADDAWHPRKLDTQMAQYETGSDFFCGTFMNYVTSKGQLLGNNVRYTRLDEPNLQLRNARAVPTPLSSILIAARTAQTAGPFDETFRRAQDFEWMLRVVKIAPLIVPSLDPLVNYYMEPDSSTANAYIEQGLAALEIKLAHAENRIPDYNEGVLRRLETNDIPRHIRAGHYYRKAGIHFGRREYIKTGAGLVRSLLISPVTTLAKLQWQIMERRRPLSTTTGISN